MQHIAVEGYVLSLELMRNKLFMELIDEYDLPIIRWLLGSLASNKVPCYKDLIHAMTDC